MLTGATVTAQRTDDATASFRRAELLLMKGDSSGAIASLSRAIELRPAWAGAYVQRGHLQRMGGQLDKAVEDYNKATELDPRSTQGNRMVAQAYTNQGQIRRDKLKLEEAISDFEKALKIFPADERPYYERARARLLLEDFAGAIADYDIFLTKNLHDDFFRAFAFGEKGLAKCFLGRDKEGEADIQKALSLGGSKQAEIILIRLAELKLDVEQLHQRRPQKKAIG